MAAPTLSFPTDPSAFDSDDRISFSRLDNKFIAVGDDGTEFEFDAQLKRWIPSIDDEELESLQRQAYGGASEDPHDHDAAAPARPNKKRKKDHNNGGGGDGAPHKKQKQNTAIYVTGLPLDVTVDEVADVFSQKCGIIAEEIDSGRPRIKLYTDSEGNFKGDALIVFFKPQSVEMAIMLLDDTDFRYTASGLASGKMRVQAADSSYKKMQYDASAEEGGAESGNNSASGNGNGNGAAAAAAAEKPRQKPKDSWQREQDKQKIIKRTQKLDAKLADWDDDEPYGAQLETNARREKMVVLRHMFTLKELEEDPAALLDIKEDVREECEKLGPVTNVVLYDLEPEGVISVKFKTPEAAEACVDLMDGRAFDGRRVRATFANGREKFKKSGKDQGGNEEDTAA